MKSIFPSFIIGFTQGIPKSVFGIIFNLLFSMLNIKLNFWEKLISGVTDFLPKSLIRIMIISVDIPFYKNSYKNKMIIIQFLVILVLYFISLEFNYLITNSITESISPISLKNIKNQNIKLLSFILMLSILNTMFNEMIIYIQDHMKYNKILKNSIFQDTYQEL